MARRRDEETLVREALPALSRAYPTALVMRNEANACTALLRAAQREVEKAVLLLYAPFLTNKIKSAIGLAFSTMSDSIKYGLGVGSADVIICHKGSFIALEFKADSDQSEEQERWQGWVERAGGVYVVVRSTEEAVMAVKEAVGGSR